MNAPAGMQALAPDLDVDRFFAALREAPRRALVLDYDGTLAPFHEDPARAKPWPQAMALVADIIKAGHTRVVIASGRWTRDLLPLLDLPVRPELWGSHGRERLLPDGRYSMASIEPEAVGDLSRADEWCEELEKLGARVERKPASIAIHWRGLPEEGAARIRNELLARWRADGEGGPLALLEFDGGLELRERSRDKGHVVRTIAGELGPGGVLAYLGDDYTDEDAFREVPANGLPVLVRPELRPTRARLWLRPPEELYAFLQRWLESDRKT